MKWQDLALPTPGSTEYLVLNPNMHSLTSVPEPSASPPAYEEVDSLTTNLPTYNRVDVGKDETGIIGKTLVRALAGLARG